ncbi:hypothetical protein STAS_18295 [Striga asiatica]|uniref:Uncharacterized protein n=1 Tax=Striga asiatica TaxID=4170 RepID=A0A5A7Q9J1_STRAF|nr:hypothetical protein STAS_18295 [Striga asiatica]
MVYQLLSNTLAQFMHLRTLIYLFHTHRDLEFKPEETQGLIEKSSTTDSDPTAWGSGTSSLAATEAPIARTVGNLLRLALTRPTIGRPVRSLHVDLASGGRGKKEGLLHGFSITDK